MKGPLHDVELALANGFYGENILYIVDLLADIRREGRVANPAAFYVVEAILKELHRRWFEQQPSEVDTTRVLEDRMFPRIKAALRAVDGEPGELLARLNETVEAFIACLKEIPVNI